MIYLILDTNIWVYLANGHDPMTDKAHDDLHFNLLKSLKELKANRDICILINDIVLNEWKRNKHHCLQKVESLKKKFANPDEVFKGILKYAKLDVEELKKEYLAGIEKDIKANEEHIVNVEYFLKNECTIIETTKEIKLKMFDLSVNNKAPFHNKKNNIADATILFSADEFLQDMLYSEDSSAIFVSNNFTDFTDSKNKEKFHPEIVAQLHSPDIKYQRVLPAALQVSKEILLEIEAFYKRELYLESISFNCRTDWCDVYENQHPLGYLDTEMPVKTESESLFNPNQLNLFPDIPINLEQFSHVRLGNCTMCGTLHIECPCCDSIFHVDDSDEKFECYYCYNEFEIHHNPEMHLVILDTEEESE